MANDRHGRRDPDELGALWARRTRNGDDILSGTIDGIDVICFFNDRSTENDRAPTWRVMKSRPKDGDHRGGRSAPARGRDDRDDRDDRRDDRDRTRDERPRESRRDEGRDDGTRDSRDYDRGYGGRGGYESREPEHVRDDPPYRDLGGDGRRGAPARPAAPARPRGASDDI